jgi:hypothetical protein
MRGVVNQLSPRIERAADSPRVDLGGLVGQSDLNAYLPLEGGTLTGTLYGLSLVFDSTTLVVDDTNDRVGVGTSTPTDTLSVAGPLFFGASAPSATTNRLYVDASGDL